MIHFATFSCFGQLLRSVASVSCFDPAASVSCFDPVASVSCFDPAALVSCFDPAASTLLLWSVASTLLLRPCCFDPAASTLLLRPCCFDPVASPRPDTTVRCPCPSHRFFVTDSCPGLSSWSVVSVCHFGLALRHVATTSCAMAVWSSGTFPLSMSSGDFRRSGMIQSSRTFAESVPKSIS